MAMVECEECKNMVSSKAKKCPHCGVALKSDNIEKTITKVILFSVVVLVLSYIILSSLQVFPSNNREEISETVKNWLNNESDITKDLGIECEQIALFKKGKNSYDGIAKFTDDVRIGLIVKVENDNIMWEFDSEDIQALYLKPPKYGFERIFNYTLSSKFTSSQNTEPYDEYSDLTIGSWAVMINKFGEVKTGLDRPNRLLIKLSGGNPEVIYCTLDHSNKICFPEGYEYEYASWAGVPGEGSADSEETYQHMLRLYMIAESALEEEN